MSERVTRRGLARRAGIGGALLGLAGVPAGALGGCTSGSQLAPAAKQLGPVTVEQWVPFGQQFQVDGVAKVVEGLKGEEPNITVVTTPSVTPEKFVAAVAAGSGPDVHNRQLGQFRDAARRGLFQPLDERMARSKIAPKSKFTAPQLEAGSQADRVYGVPAWSNGSGFFLYWNVAHFAEAGYRQDRGPATVDELLQYGERLTRFGPDGAIARLGFELLADTAWNDPLPLLSSMWDVTWYDPRTRKIDFTQAGLVAAVEFAVRNYRFLNPDRLDAFRQTYGRNNTPTSGMPQGVESMKIGGDTVLGVTAQNAPDIKLGVGWAPSAAKQTWVIQGNGHYVGLVSGSRVPEAAWRYIEYLTTPAANQIVLDVIGWLVYNKDVARALDVKKVPSLRFVLDAPSKAQKLYAPPPVPLDLGRPVADGMQRVIRGRQSPREMLQELTRQIQLDLDRALRESGA